ncbi:MAG: ester cyclase [Actinomycetota bacterium]|nr:ester cyclase [Actinomycetota bacterium]
MSNEELVRAYFERIDAHDAAGMMEFWEPGGIGNIHGIAELRAPHSYAAWFDGMFTAFPEMRIEVLEVVSDDEHAAVRWRATGTFDGTGLFEGMMPNGAEVELQGLDLFTIRHGKLVNNEAYTNGAELARQLGALPPQGSAPEKALTGLLNLKTQVKETAQAFAKRRDA